MYPIEELESDVDLIMTRLKCVRRDKGHDYSGQDDTFSNLRAFGAFGVLVRIGDKFNRLKNFYEQGVLAVQDEKITDTMDDLINYSLF